MSWPGSGSLTIQQQAPLTSTAELTALPFSTLTAGQQVTVNSSIFLWNPDATEGELEPDDKPDGPGFWRLVGGDRPADVETVLVFRHDISDPADRQWFSSLADSLDFPDADPENANRYSILNQVESMRSDDGTLEFVMRFQLTNGDPDQEVRWRQVSNPFDGHATEQVTGFELISATGVAEERLVFGGLVRSNQTAWTFYDGNPGSSNWWASVGQRQWWAGAQGGIPAFFDPAVQRSAVVCELYCVQTNESLSVVTPTVVTEHRLYEVPTGALLQLDADALAAAPTSDNVMTSMDSNLLFAENPTAEAVEIVGFDVAVVRTGSDTSITIDGSTGDHVGPGTGVDRVIFAEPVVLGPGASQLFNLSVSSDTGGTVNVPGLAASPAWQGFSFLQVSPLAVDHTQLAVADAWTLSNGIITQTFASVQGSLDQPIPIDPSELPVGWSLLPRNANAVDESGNGYVDIGQMRMQWGVTGTNPDGGTVTLPAPFANDTYMVQLSLIETSSIEVGVDQWVENRTTTTFGHNRDNEVDFADVSWLAIGLKP